MRKPIYKSANLKDRDSFLAFPRNIIILFIEARDAVLHLESRGS